MTATAPPDVPREANVSRETLPLPPIDRRRQVTQPDGRCRQPRWPADDIALLGRLWRAGCASRDLATLFRTTTGNVRVVARRHGFRRWTERPLDEAMALIARGGRPMSLIPLANAALGKRRSAPLPRPLRLLTAIGWTLVAVVFWAVVGLIYALTH